MTDKVIIGDATLYHGDCMDILPTLGKVDAVVTDPPYGIGEAAGKNASRDGPFGGRKNASKSKIVKAVDYGIESWDDRLAEEEINLARKIAKYQIIFGGNYYDLPPTSCWLFWDKDNSGDFADGELAWTNLKKAVRRYKFRWNGMLRANNEKRGDHPTQKPIEVMRWCLTFIPEAKTILDPFMGSGTTGVACAHERTFIGIEKERKYFDIACERIEAAYAQGRLAI